MKLETAQKIFYIPNMIIGMFHDIARRIVRLMPVIAHTIYSGSIMYISYRFASQASLATNDGLSVWFAMLSMCTAIIGFVCIGFTLSDYVDRRNSYWN